MLDSTARMAAYRAALAAAITPGAVVLDIGTGTGAMALLSCRLGARHVYAIECLEEIQIARETAAANGLADRITFIRGDSMKVDLPEKVDLIVEDLRGALPLLGTHIPVVVDARTRFLRPGGRIISCRDTLYCAVIEAEELYDRLTRPWRARLDGIDLSVATRYVTNSLHKLSARRDQLLTDGRAWATIDYATVGSASVSGSVRLEIARKGTGHGLLLWFDGELFPGVVISNAPGQPATNYVPLFLPWPEPVSLDDSRQVDVKLRADYVGSDYVFTWESSFVAAGARPGPRLRFRQSEFTGTPKSRELLAKSASSHRPAASADGMAARFVLERMNGSLPLAEIAFQLSREYPEQFPSTRAALDFAAQLSACYGI